MLVVRTQNNGIYPSNVHRYNTDLTDIREVAEKYGQTEDTLRLYDDNGTLIAVAVWPQGSHVYKYAKEPNLERKMALGARGFQY